MAILENVERRVTEVGSGMAYAARWTWTAIVSTIALAFTAVFMTVLLAIGAFVTAFIRGVVIAFAWTWFISPLFGIRPINLSEAVGLSIFVSILWPQPPSQKSEKSREFAKTHPVLDACIQMIATIFIAPVFLLGFAWAWHTYGMNISVPDWLSFLGP